MGEFSIIHWLVVLIVAMILFGPAKLPEIAKSLGKSLREFRKAFKDASNEMEENGLPEKS